MFEVNKSGTGTGAVREDHVDGDQEDRKNRIRMKYGIVPRDEMFFLEL